MLKLYIGPAGSGKTAAVMDEIRRRVLAQAPDNWLIVPEQYSHEAERELCLRCGDTMSRYAEVFSFSGLARRVLSEQGGAARPVLDKGGRLLCMSLALSGVGALIYARIFWDLLDPALQKDYRERVELFPLPYLPDTDKVCAYCRFDEEGGRAAGLLALIADFLRGYENGEPWEEA